MFLINFRDRHHVLRLNVFKGSPDYAYLIADSELKFPEFVNCNVLTLPGSSIQDVYSFVPFKGLNKKTVFRPCKQCG